MPVITALKGTLTVTAKDEDEKVLFSSSQVCYGQTTGELFDNIVEASILIYEEAQTWITLNKGPRYDLNEDWWWIQAIFPDLSGNDTGSGQQLEHVKDIVRATVEKRTSFLEIFMASREHPIQKVVSNGGHFITPKHSKRCFTMSNDLHVKSMRMYGLGGVTYDEYTRIAEQLCL